MNLILGKGLDNIYFGLSFDTMKHLLGKPDKLDSSLGSGNTIYIYNSIHASLWLNEEGKLHWIQCKNPNIKLNGFELIGESIDILLPKIAKHIGQADEIDDYGAMDSYSFNEFELELQVEYGVVSTICFGHYWGEEGEPIYRA